MIVLKDPCHCCGWMNSEIKVILVKSASVQNSPGLSLQFPNWISNLRSLWYSVTAWHSHICFHHIFIWYSRTRPCFTKICSKCNSKKTLCQGFRKDYHLWFEHNITMVFCYQNCSDPLWEKIVLVIEKNFWTLRLKAENLPNFCNHYYS